MPYACATSNYLIALILLMKPSTQQTIVTFNLLNEDELYCLDDCMENALHLN